MVKNETRCSWVCRHRVLHKGSRVEREQFVLGGKTGEHGVEGVDLMPKKLSGNILNREGWSRWIPA